MKSFWMKVIGGSGWAFLTLYIWEMMEEVLENAIAYMITNTFAILITRAVSTFAVVAATQGLKTLIKKILSPIVKKITYKEGNDKMKFFKKFWEFLKANKFSLIGTASAVTATLSGSGLIAVEALPELLIGSFNLTPVLYYFVLGALSILGVSKKGWETISTYLTRVAEEKAIKAEKALVKEAQKEIADEKKAEMKLVKEAKKEVKKEEKAKAKAEHKEKIAEVKANLIAEASKTTEEK